MNEEANEALRRIQESAAKHGITSCPERRAKMLAERLEPVKIDPVFDGVPQSFKGWTLKTWSQLQTQWVEAAVEASRAFRVGHYRSMYVHGPVGTGKTGYAVGLIRKLLDEGIVPSAKYLSMGDYVSKNWEWRGAALASIPSYKVVIIDDMSPRMAETNMGREHIYPLMDKCYTSGVRMVITSEVPIAQLRSCVDLAAIDRMYEGGLYEVHATGGSLRQ